MSNYEFISIERAKLLEENIAWLSSLTSSDKVIHVMTNTQNREDWNIEKTNLLHELQVINKRRIELLKLITNE